MVLILDTDPGVDDMLALLLLLSAAPTDPQLRLISLSYGNCSLWDTLNNTLSMFHVIDQENKWRTSQNLPLFTQQRPAVYLGASHSLTSELPPEDQEAQSLGATNKVDATDVHGRDGLAGIHEFAPQYDAPKEWFQLFEKQAAYSDDPALPFIAGGGQTPSWRAILDLLRSEPEHTVTIVAVGPLTNVSLAAKEDPKTFSRVKQVLSMGGALHHAGNITPLAEFNVYADSFAAACVYALTSKRPESIMPTSVAHTAFWKPMDRPLRLVIFPLDLTERHEMWRAQVEDAVGGAIKRHPGSVLAKWILAWLSASFADRGRLVGTGPDNAVVHLHDPLTAAYALELGAGQWEEITEDVRVEHSGHWSAGLTIADTRRRARVKNNPHDLQKWLTLNEGNNVTVVQESPFLKTFPDLLLKRIVGL